MTQPHDPASDTDTYVLFRDEVPSGVPSGATAATETPQPDSGGTRRWGPLLALALSGVVLAAAVAAGLSLRRPAELPLPHTGDCVALLVRGDGAAWEQTACTDVDRLAFKVATTGAGQIVCPDGAYLTYQQRGTGNGRPWACLVPLYAVDRCYDTTPLVPGPVACEDPAADFKVARVLTGPSDPGACGGGAPLHYAAEQLTQCTTHP